MKRLVIATLFCTALIADTHYSRVLPFESYNIKAATAGSVKKVYNEKEGRSVNESLIVKLDDSVDRIQLEALQVSLIQIQKQIEINSKILLNLKQSLQRQRSHFERVQSLDTRPQSEKDSAFYSYVNANNQYLQTKEKVSALIEKEANTKHSIANLKDMIEKKSFEVSGFVDSIEVTKGDYLNPGSLVATVKDDTKAKLELFLSSDELDAKEIYIEGKKYEKGFDKIWKVTDDTHISSYKARIILQDLRDYRFGQLLKVEVK